MGWLQEDVKALFNELIGIQYMDGQSVKNDPSYTVADGLEKYYIVICNAEYESSQKNSIQYSKVSNYGYSDYKEIEERIESERKAREDLEDALYWLRE